MTIRERQQLAEETNRKFNPIAKNSGKPLNQEPRIPQSDAKLDFAEDGHHLEFNSTHEVEVITTGELSQKISNCLRPVLKDYIGCTIMPETSIPKEIAVPINTDRINPNEPIPTATIRNPLASNGNGRTPPFVCLLYFADGGGIGGNDEDSIKCIQRYEYPPLSKRNIVDTFKFYDKAYGSKLYRLTDDAISVFSEFVESDRMVKINTDDNKQKLVPDWNLVRTEICEYSAITTNPSSNRILVCVRLDAEKLISKMYGRKINGRHYDYSINWVNLTAKGMQDRNQAIGEIMVGIYKLDRERIYKAYSEITPSSISFMGANIR